MPNDYFVFSNENNFEEEDYFEGESYEGYKEHTPCEIYNICSHTCPEYRECHLAR